ncbi:MAG: glycosyltransferase family 4 protein [Clostridiales bacterium]|mgnify:CR=1 FL=1|nr:glycosyltransferase family 4 protein [Clostridiales bacterium]
MTDICIFNGDMSRGGGTERITQLLANLLAERDDYRVWVLNLNNEKNTSFYPLSDNVDFAVLPGHSVPGKMIALWKFVRRHKIDIIVNVDIMLGIYSLPVSYLYPRMKLVSWEMFNIRNDIGSRNTKRIRQISLRRSACYVTQTRGDMEAFQREMRVKCPITYIHNPCFVDEAYKAYDSTSKTIVTAGHFFYTKGYDLAVETARLVFERHPDWNWEFYGDGVRLEETKKLVKGYGLEDNVLFCGRTKHIEEAYKKAAMYVMTSRTEGFGLVLTEAKSYNLPTLSFDIDFGPREIIENDISGCLVEAFDIQKMADRICELIEDAEKRRFFSLHARDNLKLFSPETFRERWLSVIDTIQKQRKKR